MRFWFPAPLYFFFSASILSLTTGSAAEKTPPTAADPGEIPRAAVGGVKDLLDHWWIGDEKTGHLLPTHGGCETKGRGVIWERAVVICALEGLSMATGDAPLRERIRAQWLSDKTHFAESELEACGPGSPAPWCDDAAWQVLYYSVVFQQTGDVSALDRAKGLIRNIHARWSDDQLDGGLWYNDQRKVKSLYAVAYVYGCLGIYEATGERTYLDLALEEYRWIETHLLRADHLYWCDYSAGPPADPDHPRGPVGSDRPGSIHTAGSVVYLGGNMGMGACQAYLYSLTGKDSWRLAALRTAAALAARLTDSDGRYFNDRDAFNDGIFASFWARRMMELTPSDAPCFAALRATATSIAASRTTAAYHPAYGPGGAGYYPGDWDGRQVWEEKGSMANMMHVSASSVGLLVAAAWSPEAKSR